MGRSMGGGGSRGGGAVAVAEAAVHIPWVEAEAEPAVRLDPDIPVATHFVDPAGVIAVSHPAAIQ